jgi:pseudouridylate synthase
LINSFLEITPEVKEALAKGSPVVALESTIIAHGMPYPKNVQTASAVEEVVRANGATPATIAIFNGKCHVGLTNEELECVTCLLLSAKNYMVLPPLQQPCVLLLWPV